MTLLATVAVLVVHQADAGLEAAPPLDRVAGYQKVTWGMSLEDVHEVYPKVIHIRGALGLKAIIAGLPAEVVFGFINGRLARVTINFDTASRDRRSLTQHYDNIRAVLEKKYGAPKTEDDMTEVPRTVWDGLLTRIVLDDTPGRLPLMLCYEWADMLREPPPSMASADDL